MKIILSTRLPETGFARLSGHDLVFPVEPRFSAADLQSALTDADILIASFDYQVTENMLAGAPLLKMIAGFGAGYNNLPVSWCKAHGIVVTNTPVPVIEPTAEQCFALMHAVARRTAELDRRLRMPDYDGIHFGVMENLGSSLYGKTLGIIGMGHIGQAVARRAVAAGMTIVYHNRHRLTPDIEARYDARYLSIDELLRTSDFVSLNLPYTPEVHHLIDEQQLRMMKPTAFLINTARGAHVNERALAAALRNRTISGAALDVYENEPRIEPELLYCDNVVLSPHIGTGTMEGRLDMCHNVEENILAFIHGDLNALDRVV
ncbi:MAG: dihydrofolate reductase [Paludibacteraceae bacterium]|nr:dihydrofolate reductase [Paludibacteraceae bacterium]